MKIPFPQEILKKQKLKKEDKTKFYKRKLEERVDHVFFLGDMNYRVDMTKNECVNHAFSQEYDVVSFL